MGVDGTIVLVLLAALVLGAHVSSRVTRWHRHRREVSRLRESWGQPLRRPRSERPVAARTPAAAPAGTYRLDDATWVDLDLGRVFDRIDRTLTSVGAQVLHRMLRCPSDGTEEIERRRALASAVADDDELRVRLQAVLARLGDEHGWEAWFALGDGLPVLPGPPWFFRLLPLTMAGTLAAAAVLGHPVLLYSGLALALALPVLHTLTNRRIGHHLEAVADLRRVLDTAAALHQVVTPRIRRLVDDVLARVEVLGRAFGRRISTPTARFGGAPEIAAEYGRAFLLTDLVRYQQGMRAIARHRADFERVLDVVGEVDAALSIACLRASDGDLREAVIDPDAGGIEAKDLRHPLVEHAVGNDLELGAKGLLLTGSNMAGKSTLLRAIGVDAVLAQAIGLVAADGWRSRPLRVVTAMGARDDLEAGVSLYRAEVDRIHALVRTAGGGHLFLLDEAFRGTNPRERVAASAALLRHLHARDLVVAATHDRELCDLLADAFVPGFFTEQVEGDDVTFDYRLRPGVLQATNAIAILERTGFPAELVAEARRLAERA